ncbi:MAG: glycerol 3-phosphate ABC transporter, partial [Pseudomonadota bacterium]
MTTRFIGAVAASALMAGSAYADGHKVSFEYWYGLGGYLGEVVAETCDRFNAAQDQYEIVCVGQEGYANAVQNTIAAFR